MIEVMVKKGDLELGRIRINKIETHKDGTADYSVKIVVYNGESFAMHQRVVHNFPRNIVNALGLVLSGLTQLNEEEFRLDAGYSPDMARRFQRTLPEI